MQVPCPIRQTFNLILGRGLLKNEDKLLPSHQKPPSNTHTYPHLIFPKNKDSAQKSSPHFSSQVPKDITAKTGVGTAVNMWDAVRRNECHSPEIDAAAPSPAVMD